jgi:hypothetical protein
MTNGEVSANTQDNSQATGAPQFQMTVDLNVLDHLGINLYSNIAAVLTEAVANAWDADASVVEITVDAELDRIVIADDGVGMTEEELNGKYLRVGYRRRKEDAETGKETAKGRSVMGRKGLGKLSLFSIADQIQVQSAKSGVAHGFWISVDGIRKAVEEKRPYFPEPVPKNQLTVTKGTTITLSHVKRKRLGQGVSALRKRLARRFSVLGQTHAFEIRINGANLDMSDRGDLARAQFLWLFDGTSIEASSTSHVLEKEFLPNREASWPIAWLIHGWIGTARKPKELDDEEAGNLNGIVVHARGRLFHENVLDRLNDGRLYTKYITGQIEADFLDSDIDPDIATSDRQRVQEDDERYVALMAFLRARMDDVEARWNEWRRTHEVSKAKQSSPSLAAWLDSLGGGYRQSAEVLIAKLSALPLDNEEDRKDLFRHGILAFERMKLRGSTDALAKNMESVDKLLVILADRDALEASLYRDIVNSRLEAIKGLQNLVDDNAKERALQEWLWNHLWLLDASWERAAGSVVMETRLRAEGVVVDDLTRKEELGRVDLKYRTVAGKHIIVELKKAGRKMKLLELVEQGQLYVDKLKKILAAQGVATPDIEVVFVLGKAMDEETSNVERLKSSLNSISLGSRIVHYDTLILGAQEQYAAYLAESAKADKLSRVIEGI